MNASFAKSLMLTSVLAAMSAAGCSDEVEGTPDATGARAAGGSAGSQGGSKSSGASDSGGKSSLPDAGEPGMPVGGGGAAPTDMTEAVYALATQVLGGETDSQTYVLLTSDLDRDVELSIDRAVLEVKGRALAAAPDGSGALFIASDQGPNVTRYDLNEAGALVKGASVSFLNAGITKFGEYSTQFQFVSDDKAYWFDGPTSQVVVWNPSTMRVVDTVPLPGLAAAGQVLSFTTAPVRDGDMLYLFAAWRENLIVQSRVAVIAVDTATDEVTIVEDDRCGYVRDGVLAEDGYLYLATEAFASAAHYLDGTNPAPCMLRFDVAAQEFDGTFHVELSDLVDGAAAGTLVEGPNKQAFLRVLDSQSAPADVTNPRFLASAPVWSWVSVTLGDEPSVAEVDAPLSSGSVLRFALGDRVFGPMFSQGTDTVFVELTAAGPAADAVAVPGLTFSAAKLR